MKNLIGMTDFVLKQEEKFNKGEIGFKEFVNNVCNYAKFLKQPLELWMFVPCDLVMGKVIVLEVPRMKYYDSMTGWNCPKDARDYENELSIYQQAKERCLFEGWDYNIAKFSDNPFIELRDENNSYLVYDVDDKNFQYAEELFTDSENKNIEDIVKYNLQLTKTTQKTLGWI